MKLTEHSRHRFLDTFARWEIPRDYADPIYNYLVYGFAPGSFFTALLSNNAMAMIQHSHPSNPMPVLKNVVGWIEEYCPGEAWGDVRTVSKWLELDPVVRRKILELQGLIYPEEEEIMKVLKSERTVKPHLW